MAAAKVWERCYLFFSWKIWRDSIAIATTNGEMGKGYWYYCYICMVKNARIILYLDMRYIREKKIDQTYNYRKCGTELYENEYWNELQVYDCMYKKMEDAIRKLIEAAGMKWAAGTYKCVSEL